MLELLKLGFAAAEILAKDWIYSIVTVDCLVRRHLVILERQLPVNRSVALLNKLLCDCAEMLHGMKIRMMLPGCLLYKG